MPAAVPLRIRNNQNRTNPVKTLTTALLAFGLFSLSATEARAFTIYTYTGNKYTAVVDPYTTDMFITGTLALLNPLAPQALGPVSPLAFSFSDGGSAWNSAFPLLDVNIELAIDGSGAITDWIIQFARQDLPDRAMWSQKEASGVFDLAADETGGAAQNFDLPGTWTRSEVASLPDASHTLGLFAVGLLALAGAARWFNRGNWLESQGGAVVRRLR
jgi:hypothetical protein